LAKSKIKAILFDKDGVLVNFQQTYGIATREIMARLSDGDNRVLDNLADDIGFELASNHIDPLSPLVGGCAQDICAVWAHVLNRPNDRAFQVKIDAMFKVLTEANVVLIEGVATVLAALEPDYHMGIATNDTEACATAQLTFADVIKHFGFLSGYDSGHGPKPGTGMATAFMQEFELSPHEVVMVGDSAHDMHFARDAGMLAIGVATGPLSADELEKRADVMLLKLDELPGFLQQIQSSLA